MIRFITENNHPASEWQTSILNKLKTYNRAKCRWLREHPASESVNFYVFDEDTLIGGAIGHTEYNWYVLDLLYMDDTYRGQQLGSQLLHWIESFAQNRMLTGVRLETWDFQAKDFYQKNGYTVFAELDDCPPGSTVFFLKKEIHH